MDLATIDRSIEDIDIMCRIVRAAPPERFRMSGYYCGTAACFAGWSGLDDAFAARLGIPPVYVDYWSAAKVVDLAIPAVQGAARYYREDRSTIDAPWFLYGCEEESRASKVDDAPFHATPSEIAALGEKYALGLAAREAALNRAAIMRACLVKWRAALVAQLAAKPSLVGAAS